MESATATKQYATTRWRNWSSLIFAAVLLVGVVFSAWASLTWAATATLYYWASIGAALLLLLLPGLALIRLFWQGPLDLSERWPLAIGLSVALLPVLLLLSQPLGLHWGSWSAWGLLALSVVIVLWPRAAAPTLRWRPTISQLLLLLLTGIALLTRLYVVRGLEAGLYGDAYQHTVMAQLIADHGGLFDSWEPYAPLVTFTYHYGFHTLAAWLSWLSGLPVTQTVLMIGQILNAATVPVVYLLTRRMIGQESAGLWAALIATFLIALPAYYVNWGRYTQLAGQTVLPAVAVVWLALFEQSQRGSWRSLIRPTLLTVLATSGLALTHYRVAVFAACLIFTIGICCGITLLWKRDWYALRGFLINGMLTGVAILLLLSPWLLRLREGALLKIGSTFVSNNVGSGETNSLPALEMIPQFYLPIPLMILAALGVFILLWQRRWQGIAFVLWGPVLIIAANPYLVGLNGAGILTNFALLIAAYLWFAPLAGAAIEQGVYGFTLLLQHTAYPAASRVLPWLQCAIGAVLLFGALGWQQQLLVPQNQLLVSADVAAIAWIRSNLPADAKIYVNSFPAYGNTLYAGSDGGWWLAFLSGRTTNLPPLTYGSEASDPPGLIDRIHTLNQTIDEALANDPDAAATALQQAGFSYLYDGPTAVNSPGELVSSAMLAPSSRYEVIYQQDGVTIWKVH